MEFYLGAENISRGTIREMKCSKCGFRCDCFSIIGDTEAMNYLGIIGLTNGNEKEVFITHLTRSEFQAYRTIDSKMVSSRLEKLLNRDKLIYLKKRVNNQGILYYPCENCNSEMTLFNEVTLMEYVKEGGKVYTIENYNYPNE